MMSSANGTSNYAATRRFGFVVNADSPIASWSVLKALSEVFPDHAVDVIHVARELRRRPDTLALAAAESVLRYPMDLATGKKRLRSAIFRSGTVFRFVKTSVTRVVSPETHDFVFQMQSLWSARSLGVPHFIYTDHTNLTHKTYPDPDPAAIYDRSFLRRESEVYQNASAVFTRSSNVTRDVIERYGADPARVECVYAGANTDGREAPDPRAKRRPDSKSIVFVGMDWERKGGPDLVRAFEIVSKVYDDAELIIIGCEPDGLSDRRGITVLGRLPNDQLADHYAAANLFCMPTLREPFGIVYIEAMTFGLPLIGTDIGAIPDFIIPEWNGYIVQPGDPDGLAEAILSVLSDPEKQREFGKRSQTLARKRYNWTAVAERMHERISREIGRE